jgi:hypothetical protein
LITGGGLISHGPDDLDTMPPRDPDEDDKDDDEDEGEADEPPVVREPDED